MSQYIMILCGNRNVQVSQLPLILLRRQLKSARHCYVENDEDKYVILYYTLKKAMMTSYAL